MLELYTADFYYQSGHVLWFSALLYIYYYIIYNCHISIRNSDT